MTGQIDIGAVRALLTGSMVIWAFLSSVVDRICSLASSSARPSIWPCMRHDHATTTRIINWTAILRMTGNIADKG